MQTNNISKMDKFISTQVDKFQNEGIDKEHYCEKCNQTYRGSKLKISSAYCKENSKDFVMVSVKCPKNHMILSVESERWGTPFGYRLFSFIITIVFVCLAMYFFSILI